MAESNYTLPQAAAKLAAALREKLTNVEKEIQDLRARELQPKEGSLAKHEMCPLCGGPDRNGVCNCLRKNAAMGYSTPGSGTPSNTGMGDSMGPGTQPMGKDAGSMSDTGALSKAAPPTPVPKVNQELGGFKSLAPKPAPTSVAAGNQEMAGFRSLAHSPVAMPGGATAMVGAVPGRRKLASMGRPSAAVSGVIKAELPATKAVPQKKVDGAKLPKAGKSVDAKKTGAGGQVLRKDGLALASPKVPGKQPVGQGGGDAHKVLGPKVAPARLGYPASKIPLTGGGGKGVPQGPPQSVDVDVSDFDAGPAKPSAKAGGLQAAGRAEVGRLIADKGAMGNPNAPVKEMAHPDVERARQAAGQLNINPTSDLRADKRAGGVGFLNALRAMFRPAPKVDPNVNPDGTINRTPVRSQRFHGTTPLRRSEKGAGKQMSKGELALSKMGKCAGCKSEEHTGMCKGLSMNHNRTMLSVAPQKRGRK